MNKCPKCGDYMIWKHMWNCGDPIFYWQCGCGYSTLNDDIEYGYKTTQPSHGTYSDKSCWRETNERRDSVYERY